MAQTLEERKAARREASRKWAAAHREEERARHRKWRETHCEERREANRRYCETHREERRKTDRKWKESHPEQVNAAKRRWYGKHAERCLETARKSSYKLKYGITVETYEQLLREQAGVCAICGGKPENRRLSVDHDHTTGLVRGLLCRKCNSAIGYMSDSLVKLQRATRYLERMNHEEPV
jgi:hypothetical protein